MASQPVIIVSPGVIPDSRHNTLRGQVLAKYAQDVHGVCLLAVAMILVCLPDMAKKVATWLVSQHSIFLDKFHCPIETNIRDGRTHSMVDAWLTSCRL